jgi:hypothetical protein
MEPKPKLKTMNDISAAEAAKLFHAARNFNCDGDPMDDYRLRPEGFPKDIAARDFLECLDLYSKMWAHWAESHTEVSGEGFYDSQRGELADVAADITAEELAKLGAAERKVFDVFAEDSNLSNKEIGKKLGISESTVKSHFRVIFNELGIKEGRGRRRALASKSYTTSKK